MRRRAIVVGSVVLVAVTLGASAPANAARRSRARPAEVIDPGANVELDGLWLFRAGDNPAFALAGLDDGDWEQRQVPTGTTPWGFRWHGYGWYRLHLAFDDEAAGYDWVLSLGRAREVVEVYVNGALVARRGRFGSRPRGGDRVTPLAAIVPAANLRAGDNVIAARIYDPTWAGGLVAGPLLIGPPALAGERLERERLFGPSVHLVLAALALAIGLGHVVLVRGRWASREAWWLGGAGVGLAAAQLGGTELVAWLSPVLELSLRLPLIGAVFAVFSLAGFFAHRYGDTSAAHVTWGRVALLVLLAALLLAPDAAVFWAATPAVLVAALVAALYGAKLLAQAARRQERHTTMEFASVIALTVLLVYDGLTATDVFVLPTGSLVGALGVLLVTSMTGVRRVFAEHEVALLRVQTLEQVLAEERIGILEATAMSITHRERFLEAVVHEVVRELGVRRSSLVLAQGPALVIAAGVGLPRHMAGAQVPREGSIAGWVIANGRPITDRTIPFEIAGVPRAGQYATASFVSQPVMDGERCIGVLNASDRVDGGEFSGADEQAVADVARKLSLVLTRVGGV